MLNVVLVILIGAASGAAASWISDKRGRVLVTREMVWSDVAIGVCAAIFGSIALAPVHGMGTDIFEGPLGVPRALAAVLTAATALALVRLWKSGRF